MPQDRDNPYPYPTAEDVANAPGGREIKAARNVVVRHIPGVPRRPYLVGENDHEPIMRGVADLTTLVYRLLDAIHEVSGGSPDGDLLDPINDVRVALEHHGCPTAAEQAADKEARREAATTG
jgi:hypothetical protein